VKRLPNIHEIQERMINDPDVIGDLDWLVASLLKYPNTEGAWKDFRDRFEYLLQCHSTEEIEIELEHFEFEEGA
jgi:hypothetical protein